MTRGIRTISLRAGVAAIALSLGASAKAAVQTQWTFETSQPTTAGPVSPEIGSGTASGSHVGGGTYSTPAGNGSSHSFSSNTWAVADYYQFSTAVSGAGGVMLEWDQTSSNTGPANFVLQYSTDGITFTPFGSQYTVLADASPNPVWNATTSSSVFHYSYDLSSIPALDNGTDYFRLADSSTLSANGGTVASTGTDRVDNFTVETIPAPEPASLALLGAGGMLLAGIRRRRQA